MKESFKKIIENYQKEVKRYNEKVKPVTNHNEAVKATFDILNIISIQNDTIIKLLAVERLEKENGTKRS